MSTDPSSAAPTPRPLWMALGAAATLFAFNNLVSPYLPTDRGTAGHDYSSFLPMLLDGHYWLLENGPFATPWFSPSWCGGVPKLPNPESVFLSVPQLFTLLVDPLVAVYLTTLAFACLGFAGAYLLLRRPFRLGVAASWLGATLFAFNGFFVHRMLIGHLTFHAFMLVPWICAALLVAAHPRDTLAASARVAAAAAMMAYMALCGMANGALPAGLAILLVCLLHELLIANATPWLRRLAAAVLLALLLAGGKLAMTAAFLASFPRTDYLLPGAATAWQAVQLPAVALFVGPPVEVLRDAFVNSQWALQRHELEYSVTAVPLLVILLTCGVAIRGRIRERRPWRPDRKQAATIGLFLLLLLWPIVANVYSPGWNALLKSVPILGSSSSLVRFWSAYIPLLCVGAAVAADRAPVSPRIRSYGIPVVCLCVIVIQLAPDRSFYAGQPYPVSQIRRAYQEANEVGHGPPIRFVGVYQRSDGRVIEPVFRNDLMVDGASQLLCHQPVFGYRREHFPRGPLEIGPALEERGGLLNVKNPACYVFPGANGCVPGDHFRADQRPSAELFLGRRPFPFEKPWWQHAASGLSLLGWLGVLGLALLLAGRAWRRRGRASGA